MSATNTCTWTIHKYEDMDEERSDEYMDDTQIRGHG
jgi:hypothetical protein